MVRISARRRSRRRISSPPVVSRCARCAPIAAHSSSMPAPEVAVVQTTGGRHPVSPASSSIPSRSRTVSGAPGRSALFTTNTSAISSSPALAACTASPQPGFTTTTVVSAWPAISTSTWPTPTVSTMIHGVPIASSTRDGLGCRDREPTEVTTGRHRADEHTRVGRVVLHADAVAEDRAAAERAGRIDGEDGDGRTLRPDRRHEPVRQRRLPRRPARP